MSKFAFDSIVNYFETLTESSLPKLHEFYAEDAYFKDPFNEVHGVEPIQHIFVHMFTSLEKPRFVITSRVVEGNRCFFVWEFKFYMKNYDKTKEQTIRGGSHLVLNEQGQITSHRDYWDAAEELYEKLPVVGGLMRWLKKRANS
jgi:trehalose utilization protein